MNCIVLEGVCLYIVLFILLFFSVACVILAIAGIRADEKYEELHNLYMTEKQKNINSSHLIMRLKLKCGELEV